MKRAALSVGALGSGISGSGPSIFTLSKGHTTAEKAQQALIETFSPLGIEFDTFIGIYWNGERNGYGIKYYKGKVVEKGIYQGGQFVKSEDFDLELMQKTFKKWY